MRTAAFAGRASRDFDSRRITSAESAGGTSELRAIGGCASVVSTLPISATTDGASKGALRRVECLQEFAALAELFE